jgi:hypothetical protein
MNWLKLLMRIFQLTPVIVAGIEQIHTDASGSSKKQMAMDALALATGVASGVVPEEQPGINAASKLAGDMIDGVVATFNATGVFQHDKQAATPTAARSAPSPITSGAVHPSGGN